MNSQGTERVNEEGAIETKVDTVDYRSSAAQEEPNKEKVGVVHLTRQKRDSGSGDGILARTAAAVTNTLRSAKDAVVGRGKDKDSTNN
ncbi:hypothetical protein JCGZ_16091 [Jatropha curcas]|uniref:Uncharacterized protein n=1 Tax=Jatropha curcas TaxID=180498 RepID=A0A067LC75_JATCU|nr:hypothetical protein JCGZ_16091 [Jatropha curcas]